LCDPDVGVFAPDNVRLVTERTMSDEAFLGRGFGGPKMSRSPSTVTAV
jgi:hypothetical protein